MIEVKNIRTYKGTGIYIGRPSALGNPFNLKYYSREDALIRYRTWLEFRLTKASSNYYIQKNINLTKIMFNNLVTKYKQEESLILICHCSPLACHGDIIKEFILKEIGKE